MFQSTQCRLHPGWSFVLCVVLGLVATSGCSSDSQPVAEKGKAAEPKQAEPINAAVSEVALRTWPRIVKCQGSLFVDDSTVLGARVPGLVAKTLVDVGDQVQAGMELVALDDSEFELQLASAEAALLQARALIGLKPGDPVSKLDPSNAPPVREAKATLEEATSRVERVQKLRSQNAVAEEELLTIQAAAKVAEARYASALNGVNSNIAQVAVRSAEVDLAKQRLRDAKVLAPFAGYVQQRMVAAGTYVQVGTPLLTVVRVDTLRFRGSLPERFADDLQLGQKIVLSIESRSEPLDAVVTRITPALDMASRSLTFEARVDNQAGQLRAGLFAEAELTIDPNAQSVVVSRESLVEFAGSEKVWKIVDGSAREQAIRPGRRQDGWVEVVEGLSPGDKILQNGALGRVAKVIPTAADGKIANATNAAQGESRQDEKGSAKTEDASAVSKKTKSANGSSTEKDLEKPDKTSVEKVVDEKSASGESAPSSVTQPAG